MLLANSHVTIEHSSRADACRSDTVFDEPLKGRRGLSSFRRTSHRRFVGHAGISGWSRLCPVRRIVSFADKAQISLYREFPRVKFRCTRDCCKYFFSNRV